MTKQFYDFTDREIDRHQAAVAHLTGICPKCGDAGWWIDDRGEPLVPSTLHYCDCLRGVAERAKADREDAEAEAEWRREGEAIERLYRERVEEEESRGPQFGSSYGAGSAGRT